MWWAWRCLRHVQHSGDSKQNITAKQGQIILREREKEGSRSQERGT